MKITSIEVNNREYLDSSVIIKFDGKIEDTGSFMTELIAIVRGHATERK